MVKNSDLFSLPRNIRKISIEKKIVGEVFSALFKCN